MKIIKKIDWYLLQNFFTLLLATLFICIFILLMQFVWMHVQDLVGKGVEMKVLAEFFIYAVASVIPLALPLSILLASLISFGNLGEQFELTAMKAAGISLFRIMRPLTVGVSVIAICAVLFSNYVLPVTQVKLWALIFSLRQKSPELDIPAGEFYDGLSGYNIYVRKKNVRTGMLTDLMIYDYTKGFRDATVMVADSGKVYFTADKQYLLLCLYSGESFENLNEQQQRATRSMQNIPYRRESFAEKKILIDFSTELARFNDDALKDQHVAKDIAKLYSSIDSTKNVMRERGREQSTALVERNYFMREHRSIEEPLPELTRAERKAHDIDSLYAALTAEEKYRAMKAALDFARNKKDQVDYNSIVLHDHQTYIRKHEIELHRKFTLAFACVIFFFIGAPLGAIIRKGGLGAPVVISVVLFIIYYIIDNVGYRMAKEALWPCWQGMWLSSFVLLPIGIFLTYKAATDSGLFNPEVWIKIYEKTKEYIWTKFKRQ